jgi:hypothetical protein
MLIKILLNEDIVLSFLLINCFKLSNKFKVHKLSITGDRKNVSNYIPYLVWKQQVNFFSGLWQFTIIINLYCED